MLESFFVERLLVMPEGIGGHDAASVPETPGEVLRLEAYWAAILALVQVDFGRAIHFHDRHMNLAVARRDRRRVARDRAFEATVSADLGGERARHRAFELLERARKLLMESASRDDVGFWHVAAGIAHFASAQWAYARVHLESAAELLASESATSPWLLSQARIFLAWTLAYSGELARLHAIRARWSSEASARGDALTRTNLSIGMPAFTWLADDDPERAARESSDAMARWPAGVLAEHFCAQVGDSYVDLYAGRPRAVLTRLDPVATAMSSGSVPVVQRAQADLLLLRARALVGVALDPATPPGERADALERARIDRGFVAAMDTSGWTVPLATSLAGMLAAAEGEVVHARESFAAAAHGFELAGMRLHAAAATLALGALTPGAASGASEAQRWMSEQGVRDPRRMAAMLMPIPPWRLPGHGT